MLTHKNNMFNNEQMLDNKTVCSSC